MTRALNIILLTLAVLLLGGLEETAEACRCSQVHPQRQFCNSDVVIKAKVVGEETVYDGTFPVSIKYIIKKPKVFKGEWQEVNAVFTPYFDGLCAVHLQTNGTEYLLSGYMDSDGMHISLCGFNVPWNSLTDTQKLGVTQHYEKGCECTIQTCFTLPCESSDPQMCVWTDMVFGVQQQADHSSCIKRDDDTCAWYTSPQQT
uniref:Metalloproteinase inhibitor 1 n=1 Tax=Cynoglossus semilaevis TaxID=244447 RepID=A0A3P8VQV3_CYNSE